MAILIIEKYAVVNALYNNSQELTIQHYIASLKYLGKEIINSEELDELKNNI